MPSEPVTTPVETANSYATVAEADTYLDDSIRGESWSFLDEDSKRRALLTATKLMDRRIWDGEVADESQALAFPRTGLADYGSTQFPNPIVEGCIELAFELTLDASIAEGAKDNNTKRLKAGATEVEYFRPGGSRGVGSVKRFPDSVEEIISPLLGASRRAGESYGTSETSHFDNDPYGRSQGWS